MNKVFMISACPDCPNFIKCADPKDFTVGCKKIGNLGSPLNLCCGGVPIDCPLKSVDGLKDKINFLKKKGAEDGVYVRINDVFNAIDYCEVEHGTEINRCK